MEWIKIKSISDLPKYEKFLVIDKDGDQAVVWLSDSSLIRGSWFGFCEDGCGGQDFFDDPSHWMPLPLPPKE